MGSDDTPDNLSPVSPLMGGEPPSGFQEAMGYRLTEWRDGEAVLTMPIARQHLNRNGVVHGGVFVSLIDTVCGYAGTWCSVPGNVRRALTLSLTTTFIGQADQGALRAVGRVRGGGRRIFFAVGEVFDRQGKLVAMGEGAFRYRTGSEDPAGSPR